MSPPIAASLPLPAATTVLYGGSFDPPHLGHQMACLYLLEGCGAQQVWLLPAAAHPFNKVMSPFETRFAMCEAMAAGLPGRVVTQRIEAELGGAGRTYDTVSACQARHPQMRFALALGADLHAELARWHRWEELQAMVPVLWIGRSGYAGPPTPFSLPDISSRAVRARCRAGQSVLGLLPLRVAQHIAAAHLYEAAPGSV